MKTVDIFTDGACSGNPGVGGWGTILAFNGTEKILKGGSIDTTNNRMELTAAIEGLEALKMPCNVNLYSDSQYLVNGMTKGWAKSWQKNGWKKADKKPALNTDLWQKLLNLTEIHNVTFIWVKGHNNHPQNERCDQLAVNEVKRIKGEL